MAGSKVSNFAIGDSNIQSVMLTLDKTFKGQHQVSLTNYDTTAESQVAAGSVIEIGGALYKFDSNESITGTPSDGTVYIMAVPSGDSVTCAYTNTAPTWSDSKQGWYGTGATANNRYLEFVLFKTLTVWNYKRLFDIDARNNFFKKPLIITGSADQIIGDTIEKVNFDVATNNENSLYDTVGKKIKIQEDGNYLLNIDLSVSNLTIGFALQQFRVILNGNITLYIHEITISNPDKFNQEKRNSSRVIFFNKGDEIEFYYTKGGSAGVGTIKHGTPTSLRNTYVSLYKV